MGNTEDDDMRVELSGFVKESGGPLLKVDRWGDERGTIRF